jgi:transposase InsO family protein
MREPHHVRDDLYGIGDLNTYVNCRIDADATVAVLDRLVAERGRPPRFIRCDNGPEQTAKARHDELLAVEAFSTLLEAQAPVEDWRIEYNTLRPHSALGYLTPTDYAKAWTANHPELSQRMDQHSGSGHAPAAATLPYR